MSDGGRLLTAADARLIARPVPAGVQRVSVVVAGVTAFGFSLASGTDLPVTASLVASPGWLVASVVQSLAVSAMVLVFLAPSAAVALGALAMGAVGVLPEGNQGAPGAWLAAGAGLAVLAIADGYGTVRRDALARLRDADHATATAPDLPVYVRQGLLRLGSARQVVGVVLLVAAGGLVAWGVRDARAAEDFRASATLVEATVVEVAADGTSALVTIGDARTRVPVSNASREVGERLEARVDDASGRIEAVDDVFDPTPILIPASACAVLGVALVLRTRRLRRRLHDLLTQPQPTACALATAAPRVSGALVVPVDDATAVACTAPSLLRLVEPGDLSPGWWEEEASADPSGARDLDVEDAGDDALLRISHLTDGELLDLATRVHDEGGGAAAPVPAPDPDDPLGWSLTPVDVVGHLADGWPVLVVQGSRAYVTARGVCTPMWRVPGARRRGSLVSAEPVPLRRQFSDALEERLVDLGVAAGRWLPWLGLPVGWFGSAWLASATGRSLHLIVPGLILVALVWVVALHGHSAVELRPSRLQFRGVVADTLVPWARVRSVVVRDRTVVVRFDVAEAGDSAFLLHEEPRGRRLMHDRPRAQEVADRIRRARTRGGESAGPVRRRPSQPTVVAVLWLVALFVPPFLA